MKFVTQIQRYGEKIPADLTCRNFKVFLYFIFWGGKNSEISHLFQHFFVEMHVKYMHIIIFSNNFLIVMTPLALKLAKP